MKRLISISTVIVLFLCLLSCSKSDSNPGTTLVATPEADAAEDNSSGGVYKGAFVGSSGVIKITLQKGKIEMILTLDGVSKTLTTTGLANWKRGDAITNVIFANGDWSATLNVSATGTGPSLVITIPGHSIGVALLKEKSTALIKGYEGKYVGSESGAWNFVIRGEELRGVSRSSTSTSNGIVFEGIVSGNTITIPSVGAVGTINGDNVSGTWQNVQDPSIKGTWSGKRTL